MSSNDSQLGSLAQSTREADLRKTRNILLAIGILTLAVNGFMFANSENEVRQVGLNGADFDRVVGIVRIIYGIGLAMGAFFLLAGIFLKSLPVPLTILSLIIYVGGIAGFGFLDPTSLLHGIVIKVIVIIALGKSVQTAMAYQREKDAQAMA